MSTAPASSPAKAPNHFQLQGHGLHITYSTSGIDGQPHFTYQDAHQTSQFAGKEIRAVPTEIGTLVSVTIRKTVDTGLTSFSLMVPSVNLGSSLQAHINTFGVTTIHKFSVVPPQGQTEIYAVKELKRYSLVRRFLADQWRRLRGQPGGPAERRTSPSQPVPPGNGQGRLFQLSSLL